MAALSPTAATVIASGGAKSNVTLGATLIQGVMVYKDLTDSNVYIAASNAALVSATGVRLLITAGADGQPGQVVQSGTVATMGTTEGVPYFLGTGGEIVPLADLGSDDFVVYVGTGGASGSLILDIHETGAQVQ